MTTFLKKDCKCRFFFRNRVKKRYFLESKWDVSLELMEAFFSYRRKNSEKNFFSSGYDDNEWIFLKKRV